MGFLTAHTTIRLSRPGAMPCPRGEFSPSVTDYRWDEDRRDIVTYNGLWYAVKKYNPTGYVPAGQYPSPVSAYWTLTSQFEIIITSMMMADAIRTNALNVNDKFIVRTDGSVDMEGILHSLGRNTECIISDGYLRIAYKGEDLLRLSVNENTGVPELNMNYEGNSVQITPERLVFGFKDNSSYLTLEPATIGYGVIRKTSDGLLYVADYVYEYVTCWISVSPSGGGTTIPEAGMRLCRVGESEYVEAVPADGYEFDRWSDGGSRRHLVTWNKSNSSLTAYFKKKEDTTVKYTVTLSASPSAGGTVSGGGTYPQGTVRTVTATPASGYVFVRWSDGGARQHSVTWNQTKSLVAYFEQKTVTGDELLLGTSLTSSSYWAASGGCSVTSVTGGVATLRFPGTTENGSAYVSFNKGRLGGKLSQGHTYRFTMEAKSSVSGNMLVAYIGDVQNSNSMNVLFYGDAVNDGTLSTSYKTSTAEFTAIADSTSADWVGFATTQPCTLTIRSISLKEI